MFFATLHYVLINQTITCLKWPSRHNRLSVMTSSSDVFTNLFHEFFSVEKENFLLIQKSFFLSLTVEKEIKINIR